MKALTLYPVWGTLMALEEKLNETRSFQISYRGVMAIHNASRITDDDRAVFDEEPYYSVLAKHGFKSLSDLPLGCIVATALLTNIYRTEDVKADLSAQELAFGNYEPGRYAWSYAGLDRILPVLKCKGKQSVWDVDIQALRSAA